VTPDEKAGLRRAALAARDTIPAALRAAHAEAIAARLAALPAWSAARTVCTYVGVRSEVATLPLLARALAEGKRVAVPACAGEVLELVLIESERELAAARFGLLEPPLELRARAERRCPVEAVELFVVPGVAFDREGGRVGYGRGFYDRLLAGARPGVLRVGLAFEAQLAGQRLPAEAHDVPLDLVLTERAAYGPAAGWAVGSSP